MPTLLLFQNGVIFQLILNECYSIHWQASPPHTRNTLCGTQPTNLLIKWGPYHCVVHMDIIPEMEFRSISASNKLNVTYTKICNDCFPNANCICTRSLLQWENCVPCSQLAHSKSASNLSDTVTTRLSNENTDAHTKLFILLAMRELKL